MNANPCTSLKEWIWQNPRDNIMLLLIVSGGVVVFVLFVLGVSYAAPTLLGTLLLLLGGQQVEPHTV